MFNTRKEFGQLALVLLIGLVLAACGGTTNQEQAREEQVARSPDLQQTAVQASQDVSAAPSVAVTTPSVAASAAAASNGPAPSAAAAAPAGSATAAAQPFDPASVTLGLEEVARGLVGPLFVTHAADGSVFVVEKRGMIQVFPGGDWTAAPQTFLDIGARVRSSGSEQGLLGLALHPQFADNGYLYVNYIDRNGATVVSRFTRTGQTLAADPASEQVVLRQEQPAANHNGGMLAFGPDGYLYIGLGDGGGANDQFGNGQNVQTWLGKLLRIDVDGGQPYAVPADNPFAQNQAGKPEIWAYGLRNPWRFSFDRTTNDLYIGDVGQNRFEYIHFQPGGSQGGQNYGWPILEGIQCFRTANCDRTGLTQAIVDYPHEFGCSVTGGYVYRGTRYPALQGVYVFGDYCSGRMWTLTRDEAGAWQKHEALQSDAQISSFGEDAAGEMYVTDLTGGRVLRVTASR